ncbi:hypothetical protein [Kribbella swartbergensis]
MFDVRAGGFRVASAMSVLGYQAAWDALQDSNYPMDISQECGLLTPHDVPGGVIRAMAAKGHEEMGTSMS